MEAKQNEVIHNRASLLQLFLFSFNNTSTNLPYIVISSYFLYYSQNFLGLSAVIIGWIITGMRLFDGITDPVVGFLIDKTDTKFGKFRPWMVAGNIIIIITFYFMFTISQDLSEGSRYALLIGLYFIHIIGYTMQTAPTKGGGTIITSDPKQRPIIALFTGVVGTIVLMLFVAYIPFSAKFYEEDLLDPAFWNAIAIIACVGSFVCMILAVIGIWKKDVPENYLGFKGAKVKFSDYASIIKKNRAMQMLIVAAATDKLAFSTVGAVTVYFFANVMLNNDLNATFSIVTLPATFIGMFLGTYLGRKYSQKKAFVFATWVALASSIICVITFPDVGSSLTSPLVAVFFIAFWVQKGFSSVTGTFVITMISDCSDYETYLTGKAIPGMMGTLFSFVDKLVSSLNGLIIGGLFALFALQNTVITPLESADNFDGLNTILLIGMFIMPILGYVASLIAMKFYPLDEAKMNEVSQSISLYKQNQNDPRSEAYVENEA